MMMTTKMTHGRTGIYCCALYLFQSCPSPSHSVCPLSCQARAGYEQVVVISPVNECVREGHRSHRTIEQRGETPRGEEEEEGSYRTGSEVI